MTREERTKLIKHLKYNRSIGADYLITDNDADEIIKALEQEPCEDCISRAEAINSMESLEKADIETYGCAIPEGFDGKRAIEALQSLPPVKPQEKTGYWIRGHHGFGCSNCHKSIEGKWDDNIDDITGTLFCPNCGAKMQEAEDKDNG